MTPVDPSREMHPTRWGDPARAAALPDSAQGLVDLAFGHQDRASADPTAEAVILPPVRLDDEALDAVRTMLGAEHVLTDATTRRLRTRGKSTPDLLKARMGWFEEAPDAVVRPADADEVATVLAWATEHRVAVVPFGGGTSVTGGLVADLAPGGPGTHLVAAVSLDLGRMRRLLAVDPVSMTATLEPGLRGPEAEALLGAHGLTLGHFPQSFEHATIGGFAATRSSGQASAGYGRFDSLVVGLTAVTPTGPLTLGVAPASAAGPDLRQLVLGSEGTLGVITSVTVRVRRRPEARVYEGWRWSSFTAGTEAVRRLVQAGLAPTVLRLSDEAETGLNLADPAAVGAASDGDGGPCLMVVGHEGSTEAVEARGAAVTTMLHRLAEELGGAPAGPAPGERWAHGRFDAPYLRDSLLDAGVLVETLETATFWSGVPRLHEVVREALTEALGEGTLVLCHVSHVYETGASLYFTVACRQGPDPLTQWHVAKQRATSAIVAAGGTVTHHHAVGRDHKPWLEQEIGSVGVAALRAVKAALDPAGILNPGVLVP
ncbi:FAD-binding oxidoreductase [Nocardioides solisilvae]|uniref:FAD-binding oxidoreductase n=1 Tax=Nocardioides solisilvae TaxID=1542435 RepID=UPI001EF6BBE9|nr:FAD-binding oxidoreductase [Nocardioides solisilvae]